MGIDFLTIKRVWGDGREKRMHKHTQSHTYLLRNIIFYIYNLFTKNTNVMLGI